MHPSFLQTQTKTKMKAKTSQMNISVSMSAGSSAASAPLSAKGDGACSCKPPTGPITESGTPPPYDSKTTEDSCVVPEANPYNPINNIKSSSAPTASSSKKVISEGTKACVSDQKATNALGKIGPLTFAITQPPYKLFSCDQVFVIQGQTFVSPNNYQIRKPAVFTLSVYMINLFDTKDTRTIKNHILLENITDLPSNIQGAPTCINFLDAKTNNKIPMCFNSKDNADQIKEAFMDLLKCRIGDNLKNVKTDDVRKVFEASCLGVPITIPDNSGIAKMYTYLAPFLPAPSKKKIVGFGEYNPGYSLVVPGSVREDEFNPHHHKQEQDIETGRQSVFSSGGSSSSSFSSYSHSESHSFSSSSHSSSSSSSSSMSMSG